MFLTKLFHEWTHFKGYQDSLIDVLSPGHVTGEILFTLVFDGLVGALLFPFAKSWIRRHDATEHANDSHVVVDNRVKV